MKRVLPGLAMFVALLTTACGDQASPTAPDGGTDNAVEASLTLVNKTGAALELVCWAEPDALVWFSDCTVWDSGLAQYVSAVSVGGSVTRTVTPNASAFGFWFVNGTTHYRTASLVSVEAGTHVTFTMEGTTLVRPLAAGMKDAGKPVTMTAIGMASGHGPESFVETNASSNP